MTIDPERFRDYVEETKRLLTKLKGAHGSSYYFVPRSDANGEIFGINVFPDILSYLEVKKDAARTSEIYEVQYSDGEKPRINFAGGNAIHFACELYQKLHPEESKKR